MDEKELFPAEPSVPEGPVSPLEDPVVQAQAAAEQALKEAEAAAQAATAAQAAAEPAPQAEPEKPTEAAPEPAAEPAPQPNPLAGVEASFDGYTAPHQTPPVFTAPNTANYAPVGGQTYTAPQPAAYAYQNPQPAYANTPDAQPAAGAATASMVLGIVSLVFCLFGEGAIVSVVCGIIGLVMASKAKAAGNVSSARSAGFIMSLIGLIGGALVFVSCSAIMAVIGILG